MGYERKRPAAARNGLETARFFPDLADARNRGHAPVLATLDPAQSFQNFHSNIALRLTHPRSHFDDAGTSPVHGVLRRHLRQIFQVGQVFEPTRSLFVGLQVFEANELNLDVVDGVGNTLPVTLLEADS